MNKKYHGILLLNKPAGMTSHDVVNRVRSILKIKEVGHAGTLDPMAQGLMVLLVGEATKLSHYILEREKAYGLRVQLGITTDTFDITGQVLEKKEVMKNQEQIREEVLRKQGEFELPVPIYSATKVKGLKLYEYARQHRDVEIPIKKMKFFDFEVTDQGSDWIDLNMRCSKGAYVRSWVNFLGQSLGCGASLGALIRKESFPYKLSQAISLEELTERKEESTNSGLFLKGLIPVELVLDQYKFIRVKGKDEVLILNGTISNNLKNQLISIVRPGIDEGVRILSGESGKLLSLIGLEAGQGFVIRRGFRY